MKLPSFKNFILEELSDDDWLYDMGMAKITFDVDWSLDSIDGVDDESMVTKWSAEINGQTVRVVSVVGQVDEYSDDLTFELSNGDTVYFRAYFGQSPFDKDDEVTLEIVGQVLSVAIDPDKFSEKIGDTGSVLLPVLQYYTKYKKRD